MDSLGNLLSLTNHRSFSERLLARVDHVVCAKIEQNKLYLYITTRGMIPKEWLLTLSCSASDPARTFAALGTIEEVIKHDECHAIVVTSPLDPQTDFRGDLPCSTAVLLEANGAMKTYNMPGVIGAAKPQP
jgi:hypothetical protein